MKPKVVNRTHTTITLDTLPADVQMGDKVQLVSPSGKVRGKSKAAKWMEYSPLVPLVMFFVWWMLNADNIRHGWLLGLTVLLLFFTVMAMTIAMDDK
jgi:hypothetical protein